MMPRETTSRRDSPRPLACHPRHQVRAMHIPGDFTNYFFANLTPAQREAMADPESAEARAAVKTLWQPVRRPRQRQTAPDSARQRQTSPKQRC